MKYFILLLRLLLFVVNSNDGCLIPNPYENVGGYEERHGMDHGEKKSDGDKWEKIRIHVEYDGDFVQMIKNNFMLKPGADERKVRKQAKNVENIIKHDIINWTVTEITKFVRVRKGNEEMHINTERCGISGKKRDYRADLVLFVGLNICRNMEDLSAAQLEQANPVYNLKHQKNALSFICSYDRYKFNRPNAACMLLCLDAISIRFGDSYHAWRTVFFHEALHVLLDYLHGSNYVDENGNVRQHTIQQGRRPWRARQVTTTVPFVVSSLPHLNKFAETHFGCNKLEGVQLNQDVTELDVLNFINQQYKPTIQSFNHFEERLFPDALMSPVVRMGKTITKMEMAILKDTGWYKIDETYPFAELTETRGKGCDYALLSCYEYMNIHENDREKIYPYCFPHPIKNDPDESDDPRAGIWGCSADYEKTVWCTVEAKKPGFQQVLDKISFFDVYVDHVGTELQADGCGMVSILPIQVNPDPLCYSLNTKDVGNRACMDVRGWYKGQFHVSESYGRCANFSCRGGKIVGYYQGLNFTCDKGETEAQKYEYDSDDNDDEFEVHIYCPNVSTVCKQRKQKEREAKGQKSCSSKPIDWTNYMKMTFVLISVVFIVRHFSGI